MPSSFHERYDRPEPKLPSDRSTGLVLAAVSLIVAYLWRASSIVPVVAIAVSATLAALSLVNPKLLHPVNVAWMRVAHLLSRVMNPVVMLILFCCVIVPAGFLMQLMRDPLRRHRRNDEKSYWVLREARESSSMKNQF